jgi:flagellar basal body-associated protein FliL
VVPPQAAQRSNGLWIMLAVVLMIAVLAVIWLALRLNNLI